MGLPCGLYRKSAASEAKLERDRCPPWSREPSRRKQKTRLFFFFFFDGRGGVGVGEGEKQRASEEKRAHFPPERLGINKENSNSQYEAVFIAHHLVTFSTEVCIALQSAGSCRESQHSLAILQSLHLISWPLSTQ